LLRDLHVWQPLYCGRYPYLFVAEQGCSCDYLLILPTRLNIYAERDFVKAFEQVKGR